jgi:hypothetical protein
LRGSVARALAAVAVAVAVALGLLLGSRDGEEVSLRQVAVELEPACTLTVAAGSSLSAALSKAPSGAVLCLGGGVYRGERVPAEATDKDAYVTIQPLPGEAAVFAGELAFDDARYLRLSGLTLRGGLRFSPAASHVQLLGNDISGVGGIFLFGDSGEGGSIESVLIEGNLIHDIDYTGPQQVYSGYGIKSIGSQRRITVRGNTIRSVAADYLQTDEANEWTVDGNTFLGPSLARGHPREHQDLWQVYAGGSNLEFTNNVVRRTGTSQSLLFQMSYPSSRFADVVVANNLFDHDSRGYSCQIYQSAGLVFRGNTIAGSRFGCLFRRDDRFPDGSGYEVDHNVFAEAVSGADVGLESGVRGWGRFDYNVSSDRSAVGRNSVRRWRPGWEDRVDYRALGLSFPAGYQPTPVGLR